MRNVSIIGLGLIGGSIAKALKDCEIGSLKCDCRDLQMAVEEKVVDRLFESWEELIAWSDLIILATPLSTISQLAEEIARQAKKPILVIDVSSVKKAVMPTFEAKTNEMIEFISTHPMAGKETWGFASGDASLFEGCTWVISLHKKNRQSSIDAVAHLIDSLGAQALLLDPEEHDRQAALVSHLPALISRELLKFVEKTNPGSLKLAGPGFRSMTRLAHDNPQLQSEIASFNQEFIAEFMRQFKEIL